MEKSFLLKSAISIILTYISLLFGDIDLFIKILIACMILDYITGIIKAIINKALDSRIGMIGIAKKVMILVVVVIANLLDKLIMAYGINIDIVRDITIMFYIVNEVISILENVGDYIEIPEALRKVLKQLNNNGGNDNEY